MATGMGFGQPRNATTFVLLPAPQVQVLQGIQVYSGLGWCSAMVADCAPTAAVHCG